MRIIAFFALAGLLGACALLDLSPPNGYPARQSPTDAYGTLAPQSDFAFDENRRL